MESKKTGRNRTERRNMRRKKWKKGKMCRRQECIRWRKGRMKESEVAI
jgi:hypothetical protein